MVNFSSLSILLIHRELLSDGKRLINAVQHGITSRSPMWKSFKRILKENGKIKGGNYRMMKHSNRSIDWRLSGKSFCQNINAVEGSRS